MPGAATVADHTGLASPDFLSMQESFMSQSYFFCVLSSAGNSVLSSPSHFASGKILLIL